MVKINKYLKFHYLKIKNAVNVPTTQHTYIVQYCRLYRVVSLITVSKETFSLLISKDAFLFITNA